MATIGLSASELADAWPVLSLDERVEGFRLLAETEMDEFFLGRTAADQAALLLASPMVERRRWLGLLVTDSIADVVHEAGRFGILSLLDEPARREVEAVLRLGADDESVGDDVEPGRERAADDDERRREKLPTEASYPEDDDPGALDTAEAGTLEAFAAGTLDLDELSRDAAEASSPGSSTPEPGPDSPRAAEASSTTPVPTHRPPALVRAPSAAPPAPATPGEIAIYRSEGAELVREQTVAPGVWINVVNPGPAEVAWLTEALDVEVDLLRAALDEEERPRIEVDNGSTLIIVDVPALARDGSLDVYTTIPLGIVLAKGCVVTICLRADTVLQDFTSGRVKRFVTSYRTRFVLQVLHRSATRYLQYLRSIDKASHRIEQELQSSMKNRELIQLLKLEKSLVYFETSLKSNELVLEKLMRVENVRSFPEDRELLEDVIIENKQALEMANIYSNILSGTMDAFASIISNNLNIVMKVLTSVTIVMAIPTMISSFFGMNVVLPLAGPWAFAIIFGIATASCAAAVLLLWRTRLL